MESIIYKPKLETAPKCDFENCCIQTMKNTQMEIYFDNWKLQRFHFSNDMSYHVGCMYSLSCFEEKYFQKIISRESTIKNMSEDEKQLFKMVKSVKMIQYLLHEKQIKINKFILNQMNDSPEEEYYTDEDDY